MFSHFPLHVFQEFLLSWYEKNKRDLPWRKLEFRGKSQGIRNLRDPYRILVSELMLQQTQVTRVTPKLEGFLLKWPTIQALADAPLSDVLVEWKGLGYNRRAKHLLETAKIVVHSYDGAFPSDLKTLSSLPGFGSYMISALRVFAFGKQEPVVDVNVARVIGRVQALELQVRNPIDPQMRELAEQSIPNGKADVWHQALMDFGSSICTSRKPKCSVCPLSRICRANKLAKAQGFEDFSQWLDVQPKLKKESKKDKGKKFEETDRYFRGRIIDFLREGKRSMEELHTYIHNDHHLEDRKRFGSLIEQLVIDGLIVVRGNTVGLVGSLDE